MAKKTNKPKEDEAKPKAKPVVNAPMPIECPHCRSSKTTAANGVHYNVHFFTRYEHRVCSKCGYTFTAARRMTAEEIDEHGGGK